VSALSNVPRDRAIPHWLAGADGRQTFAWTHLPATRPRRRTGIQIVAPVGPEYLHSHRAVRHLARVLARLGFVTVRHDHEGMANSTGDLRDAETWAHWDESCELAHQHLRAVPGVDEVVVVALRSGSLVAQRLMARHQLSAVVHWFPYLKGSVFVRDLALIDSMLDLPAPDGPFIEAGGYPLHERTHAALRDCDLLAGPLPLARRALIVNDAALPVNDRLRMRLDEAGIAAVRMEQPGLGEMMRQAELMQVPGECVAAVSHWLDEAFPATTPAHELPPVRAELDSAAFRERPFAIAGPRPMLGLLTESLTPDSDAPLLVLLNAGAAHHVGPNRLHVDLARAVAAKGISSLRLDISNLGESAEGLSPAEHHPYAPTAAADVTTSLAELTRTTAYARFVLCGLCSGAHNSFQGALAAPPGQVAGLVLLNPLTFYWRSGDDVLNPEGARVEQNAAQFGASSRDPRKWLRLLTEPRRLARVGLSAGAIAWARAATAARALAQSMRLGVMTPLERDLRRLLDSGVWISVLTAESEPGYAAMRASAGRLLSATHRAGHVCVEILPETDHTFTAYASRQDLIRRITAQLSGPHT